MISVKRIRFYTAVKCVYTSVNAGDVANHIANEHDCEASYSVKKVTIDTIHHDAVTHEEPVYSPGIRNASS